MDAKTITTGQGVTPPETKGGMKTVGTIDVPPATTTVTETSHLMCRVARTEAMVAVITAVMAAVMVAVMVVTTDKTAMTIVDTILAAAIPTQAENPARTRTSSIVAITITGAEAAKTMVAIGMITTKTLAIREDKTEDKVAAIITDLKRQVDVLKNWMTN